MSIREKILRRTKKLYAALFDDPTTLFPGVETTLFPNGEREIWFRDTTSANLGLKIKVSQGPAGFGVTIERLAPTRATLNVCGEVDNGSIVPPSGFVQEDVTRLDAMFYYDDPYSQQFKRWHNDQCTTAVDEPTTVKYPGDMGLKPDPKRIRS